MSYKDRLKSQMVAAREFTEKLLADFKTPEQWTHQVHPRANHALWFAGHMGFADNFFISLLAPQEAVKAPEGFESKFGMGSQPVNDPKSYPSPQEVVEFMRSRRKTLLEVLDGLQDADLGQSMPGAPDFIKDKGAVFEMAIWHEGLHSGQVTVAHRDIGKPPVFSA